MKNLIKRLFDVLYDSYKEFDPSSDQGIKCLLFMSYILKKYPELLSSIFLPTTFYKYAKDVKNYENEMDLFRDVFTEFPNIFWKFPEFCNDEMMEFVLEKDETLAFCGNVLEFSNHQKGLVEGFSKASIDDLIVFGDPHKIIELVKLSSLDDINLLDKVMEYITSCPELMQEYIDHDVLLPLYDMFFEQYFCKIMSFINDKIINSLSLENQKIANDALSILKLRNKVDTVINNADFTYKFVKEIYPIVGLKLANNLLSYDSGAILTIYCLLRDDDGVDLVNSLLELNRKYKIFDEDSRDMHFLFKSFYDYYDIFNDLLNNDYDLTRDEVNIFRGLLMRVEYLNADYIHSFKDYVNYFRDKKEKYYIFNTIAVMFGFVDFDSLKTNFFNYGLTSFIMINGILKRIKEVKGSDYVKDFLFTKEEAAIILFIQKAIKIQELDELESIEYNELLNDDQFFKDNIYIYRNIINKVRRVYNEYLNVSLTKIGNIDKSLIDTKDGVNIYEIVDDDYKLLVHCINNFDDECVNAYMLLSQDLSLFDRLEGSSTISLSTFCNKGIFMCNNNSYTISLLFDEVPSDFLLYMSYSDLLVTHGKRVFEPSSVANYYASYDGLIQRSFYNEVNWNELAGYRDGMIPSAILVSLEKKDEVIDDNLINAAKYFSSIKGKEVPIIVLSDSPKKEINVEDVKNDFLKKHDKDSLRELFYTGNYFNVDNKMRYLVEAYREMIDQVNFVLESLNYKLDIDVVSFDEYIALLNELVYYITDVYMTHIPNSLEIIKRLRYAIKYLAVINKIFNGDISNIKYNFIGDMYWLFSFNNGNTSYQVSLIDEIPSDGKVFNSINDYMNNGLVNKDNYISFKDGYLLVEEVIKKDKRKSNLLRRIKSD